MGVLEIKCPFCARKADSLSDVASERKQFCLHKESSCLKLSLKHQYYKQCQLQMHVTQRTYCDFVVWRHHSSLHIERLKPDQTCISEALSKAKQFLHSVFFLSLLESGSLAKEISVTSKCQLTMTNMKAPGAIARSLKGVVWLLVTIKSVKSNGFFGMPGNVKSTIQKMDVPHMSPSFEVKSKKNCKVEQ